MLLKSMFRNMTAFLALTFAIGAVSLVASDSQTVPPANCAVACTSSGTACMADNAGAVSCLNASGATGTCSVAACQPCPEGPECEKCCCPRSVCAAMGASVQCGNTL